MRACALAALALLVGSFAATAQREPAERVRSASVGKPALEMVFVLDTTGSMGGLIEGAKQKIWSIVNDVMKTPAHPRVRIGLVAYRDHGDAYVTKVLPITDDLDKVYSTLMDYQAGGGGGHSRGRSAGTGRRRPQGRLVGAWPEGLRRSCFWSATRRHTTTTQTSQTRSPALPRRSKAGIIVNTIECGPAEDTRLAWQKISQRGEGQFFQIEQNGGVQAIATPYDAELSKLGGKMGATYYAYGGGGRGAGGAAGFQSGKAARSGTHGGKVCRVCSSRRAGGPSRKQGDQQPVLRRQRPAAGRRERDRKARKTQDRRPAGRVQKLSPQARKQAVDKRVAERKALRAEILTLSKKRDAFMAEARKKQSNGKSGFEPR